MNVYRIYTKRPRYVSIVHFSAQKARARFVGDAIRNIFQGLQRRFPVARINEKMFNFYSPRSGAKGIRHGARVKSIQYNLNSSKIPPAKNIPYISIKKRDRSRNRKLVAKR